ncbi:15300_t:CDS:2 [Cetraspora pellucida]|uniref:15300_t:CDS:1 n=1 Tax=Cetraspora pellucida TaxID=1433469 RepID=A0A9N9AQF6_9GLOM|nr:15300_t:CDS:2 [Cetraspora pellucida]
MIVVYKEFLNYTVLPTSSIYHSDNNKDIRNNNKEDVVVNNTEEAVADTTEKISNKKYVIAMNYFVYHLHLGHPDHTLKDFIKAIDPILEDKLFKDKVIVFERDFCQILPVIIQELEKDTIQLPTDIISQSQELNTLICFIYSDFSSDLDSHYLVNLPYLLLKITILILLIL